MATRKRRLPAARGAKRKASRAPAAETRQLETKSLGEVSVGDTIEPVSRDAAGVTVTDIARLYVSKGKDQAALRRAVGVEALPASWRDYFLDQLS